MVKQAGILEKAKRAHTASVYSANKRKPGDRKHTKKIRWHRYMPWLSARRLHRRQKLPLQFTKEKGKA